MMLLENDLSNPGVRMVRLAGFRRLLFGGMTGEAGAERWFCELVSMTDAVAIGGRGSNGGGTLNDKFLRLRARRPGESGCMGLEVLEGGDCCCGCDCDCD